MKLSHPASRVGRLMETILEMANDSDPVARRLWRVYLVCMTIALILSLVGLVQLTLWLAA